MKWLIINQLFVLFSSSEPEVDATLNKLFDEMAFKQNDSKLVADVFSE